MKLRSGFLIFLFFLVLFPVSAFASTWAKSYGGSNYDRARSIQQTTDGGFIVAGYTSSYGAGGYDFWVLKLDASGNVTWQKTYGGTYNDEVHSIQQTSDGGFIVAGYKSVSEGGSGVWVLKLTANGNITWQKTYGGLPTTESKAYSIQQTSDGGYIVAGDTSSFGAGSSDIWVLKLTSTGSVSWQKTYGGSYGDGASSIQQTSDGGFIVAGYSNTFGGGASISWVLKLSAIGNIIWQKTYRTVGSEVDYALSIKQTTDGGYIVVGRQEIVSIDYKISVLKLDANGNVTWMRTFDHGYIDYAGSVQQTADGGYILAGFTNVDFKSFDLWILKLNANGNVAWQKTYGGSYYDGANSVKQTSDGGFIVAGFTESFGAGDDDVWILKLDANGNIYGCDLIQDISVVPVSTSVSTAVTSVIPTNTDAFVTNSSVIPVTTTATVEEKCFYEEPLAQDTGYAPVTPCRIIDTRKAGGAMSPGTIRGYNVWGNVASQGGNPAGCPSPNGEPYAVHINVTAVPVTGTGNLQPYPFGIAAPLSGLVCYKPGVQNVANSATVKTCFNCDKDINIKSNYGTAHVVIDVLGYYFDNPWH